MKKERLAYLEGLRGLCAIMVVLCHFLYAFYFAVFDLQKESSHLPFALETIIGASPFNFFFNGKIAVRFFFILCGFVAAIKYVKTHRKKYLLNSALKRYFRLAIPITIINLIICIFMLAGLFNNYQAALISGSTDWFLTFNAFKPSILGALIEGLYGSVFLGANGYNGVLWIMKYEFLGVLFVYLVLALIGDKKYRYVAYAIIFVFLVLLDRQNLGYASVFIGMVICDIHYSKKEKLSFLKNNHVILTLLFIAGFYLCSFPAIGSDLKGIYNIIKNPPIIIFYSIGAVMLFIALLYSDILQKIMNLSFFQKMGKISFAIYLVHFPIIAIFSAGMLVALNNKINYNLLMLIIFILTVILTYAISKITEKYIEPLGEKAADLIFGNKFIGKWLKIK